MRMKRLVTVPAPPAISPAAPKKARIYHSRIRDSIAGTAIVEQFTGLGSVVGIGDMPCGNALRPVDVQAEPGFVQEGCAQRRRAIHRQRLGPSDGQAGEAVRPTGNWLSVLSSI